MTEQGGWFRAPHLTQNSGKRAITRAKRATSSESLRVLLIQPLPGARELLASPDQCRHFLGDCDQ
jgi:hypothetical protein